MHIKDTPELYLSSDFGDAKYLDQCVQQIQCQSQNVILDFLVVMLKS